MIQLLSQFYRWDKKLGLHLEKGWCKCHSCRNPQQTADIKRFIEWLENLPSQMDPCPDGPIYECSNKSVAWGKKDDARLVAFIAEVGLTGQCEFKVRKE